MNISFSERMKYWKYIASPASNVSMSKPQTRTRLFKQDKSGVRILLHIKRSTSKIWRGVLIKTTYYPLVIIVQLLTTNALVKFNW